MELTNEPKLEEVPLFGDLFRLQRNFRERLANDTLEYLRLLRDALTPALHGTLSSPDPGGPLRASGAVGGSATFQIEAENSQSTYCAITAQLSALVNAEGVTWLPALISVGSWLLAPGEKMPISVTFAIPEKLPPTSYRGALSLYGFLDKPVLVEVLVASRKSEAAPPRISNVQPTEKPPPSSPERNSEMRILNQPENPPHQEKDPTSQFFRLQQEFHTRLADETLRYLRQLQGTLAPAVPGTVLLPVGDARLEAEGRAGANLQFTIELENRQAVPCLVTPGLSPLISETGVTWLPVTPAPTRLISPGEVVPIQLLLPVPATMPTGTYSGALLLLGFGGETLRVQVTILAKPTAKASRAVAPAREGKPPVKVRARKARSA